MLSSIFLGVLLVSSVFAQGNDEVEAYERLINSEISKANSNSIPPNCNSYKPESEEINDAGDYDYIVVGAGAAGAIIAARLSEVPEWKVLLIEAGDFETNFTNIPAMSGYDLKLDYNWNFNTTPQAIGCLRYPGRQCVYFKGRGVGGTTVLNAALYTRGNHLDYDKWAAQGPNPGWSFEEILPYYKKSENSLLDDGDEGYHGVGGPLDVDHLRPRSPLFDAFVEANIAEGRKLVDYNGKQQLGIGYAQYNNHNGKRQSTAAAFLVPNLHRENLTVWPKTLAIKLLIDKDTKTATGVLVSNATGVYKVTANKEVILSAGAVGSPQLLMLSGVGPREHLESLNIPVIADLPVGDDFNDHPSYHRLEFMTNHSEPQLSQAEQIKEMFNKSGPLTMDYNIQGLAFIRRDFNLTHGQPEVEIMLMPQRSLEDDTVPAARLLTVIPAVLHPKSRGTIRLKNTDPYDYPLIDLQLLADKDNYDLDTLYDGIQMSLKLVLSEPFKKFNVSLVPPVLQGCTEEEYLSEAFWKCAIRERAQVALHAAGTCKMGPASSKDSVVDHELKVHGIKNLRVADGSVIPVTISAHISAPCMMVGEVVSDLIKNGTARAV